MTEVSGRDPLPRAAGLVLHRAASYDFFVWLMSGGREGAFRERILRLARIEPGEAVLDVGCGTGTLAIAAKRRAGAAGKVHGIDASPEMLARAVKKARRADIDVTFTQAPAQALPFPDASFDLVLTTVMLHHLPRPGRAQCAREMRRVLKPGGRVLAVDFAASQERGLVARLHRRHGHVRPGELISLLATVGLDVKESGEVGYRSLQFALAIAPSAV
ncbi:MAG TPA: methyltransferase domain-containing protein [Stellaceae bacterium]|nr:methyltransferase domain-containing protein [Stellaceae bacterium]